jgi:hypothetical protein
MRTMLCLLLCLVWSQVFGADTWRDLESLSANEREEAIGDRVGNGGGVWGCKENGAYTALQLIDLFELENELGGSVISTDPADSFLSIYYARKAWLSNNYPSLYSYLQDSFEIIENKENIIPAGKLNLIGDVHWRSRPGVKFCSGEIEYLQLMNFTHFGKILRNEILWNHPKLDSLNKAAALMHETVYHALRTKEGDTDSVRAREINGYIFSNLSGKEMQTKVNVVLSRPCPSCRTPKGVVPEADYVSIVSHVWNRASIDLENPVLSGCAELHVEHDSDSSDVFYVTPKTDSNTVRGQEKSKSCSSGGMSLEFTCGRSNNKCFSHVWSWPKPGSGSGLPTYHCAVYMLTKIDDDHFILEEHIPESTSLIKSLRFRNCAMDMDKSKLEGQIVFDDADLRRSSRRIKFKRRQFDWL